MKDVLIKFAYDEEDNLVFAKDAIKGNKYFCPKCGEELIYRNSGKTEKGSRCPHFAHRGGGNNCDPESLLHTAFKNETAKLLKRHIDENKSLDIKWTCSDCGFPYTGNLLLIAKSVKVEYDLKVCRPDIALLDEAGIVRVVIEIVNTHKPEDNALNYYKENGIVLVQYNVVDEDLSRIEEKLKNADYVSLCKKSSCTAFNKDAVQRELKCIPVVCNRCKNQKFALYVSHKTALYNSNDWLEKEDAYLITYNRLELKHFKYKELLNPNTGECSSTFITVCKCEMVNNSPRKVLRRRNWWL